MVSNLDTEADRQEEIKMKNAKALNLKNMKETIVNYSGDQKEFDKIMKLFDYETREGRIEKPAARLFAEKERSA